MSLFGAVVLLLLYKSSSDAGRAEESARPAIGRGGEVSIRHLVCRAPRASARAWIAAGSVALTVPIGESQLGRSHQSWKLPTESSTRTVLDVSNAGRLWPRTPPQSVRSCSFPTNIEKPPPGTLLCGRVNTRGQRQGSRHVELVQLLSLRPSRLQCLVRIRSDVSPLRSLRPTIGGLGGPGRLDGCSVQRPEARSARDGRRSADAPPQPGQSKRRQLNASRPPG